MRISLTLYQKLSGVLLLIAACVPLVVLRWQNYSIVLLVAGIGGAISWFIYASQKEHVLFQAKAFLIPFSFEIEIFSGTKVLLPSEPLIAIGMGVFLIRFITKDLRKVSLTFLDGLLLLFMGWLTLTSLFSEMPKVSFKYTIVFSSYILIFYFLLKETLKKGTFIKLVDAYLFGLVCISIYSIYNSFGFGFIPAASRMISKPFFNDHTIMGAALGFGVFWSLGRLFFSFKDKASKLTVVAFLTAFFILVVNLYLGYSRAAWFSILLAASLLIVYSMNIKPVYVYAALIVLVGAFAINFTHLSDAFLTNSADSGRRNSDILEQTQSITNIQSDVSNVERINRWKSAWRMQELKPFLGFGPGTYQFTYVPFQDERDMTRISTINPYWVKEMHGGTAHSEPLLLLAETGWLGVVFWLILCAWFFIQLFCLLREPLGFHHFVVLGVFTFLLHALVNNFLNSASIAFLFWGSLAYLSHFRKQLPA